MLIPDDDFCIKPKVMDPQENKLTIAIRNGDAKAFSHLFDRHKDVLYSYALKVTRSRDLAEEAVQETFLRLWLNREKLDPGRPIQGYLFRIARNYVFNILKRAVYDERLKTHIFYNYPAWEPGADEHLILSELQLAKENAISCLPPRRQLIFRMSRKEGLSHQEIAEKLGISPNTVKDQIVKATQTIKEYLRSHGDMAMPMLIVLGYSPFSV